MALQIEGVSFIGDPELLPAYPPVYSQAELNLRGGEISVPIYFFEKIRRLGLNNLGDSGALMGGPKYAYFIRNPVNGKYFFGRATDYNESRMLYMPGWMFESFEISYGDMLEVCYAEIDAAEKPFIKLMPLTKNFYDCENPESVLDEIMNTFQVATLNFKFTAANPENPDEDLQFVVVETKPLPTVTLLCGNTEVDFAPMPGYEEAKAAKDNNNNNNNNDDDDDDSKTGQCDQPMPDKFEEEEGDGAVKLGYSTGHILVESENDYDDHTLCPTCGKYISNAAYKLHSIRCARLYTKWAECGKKMEKTAVAEHMKEFHTPVPCPECGEMVPGKPLLEKHAESCPKGKVVCNYCGDEFARCDIAAHEEACGAKTKKCGKCGKNVCLRDYDDHTKSGCRTAPEVQEQEEMEIVRDNLSESVPQCPICSRRFDSYGAEYSAHVNECVEREGRGGYGDYNGGYDGDLYGGQGNRMDYVCPVCGRAFAHEYEVEEHVNDHFL